MFDKERLQKEIEAFKKQQENLSQKYQQLNGAIAAMDKQLKEIERAEQEFEHMTSEQEQEKEKEK